MGKERGMMGREGLGKGEWKGGTGKEREDLDSFYPLRLSCIQGLGTTFSQNSSYLLQALAFILFKLSSDIKISHSLSSHACQRGLPPETVPILGHCRLLNCRVSCSTRPNPLGQREGG